MVYSLKMPLQDRRLPFTNKTIDIHGYLSDLSVYKTTKYNLDFIETISIVSQRFIIPWFLRRNSIHCLPFLLHNVHCTYSLYTILNMVIKIRLWFFAWTLTFLMWYHLSVYTKFITKLDCFSRICWSLDFHRFTPRLRTMPRTGATISLVIWCDVCEMWLMAISGKSPNISMGLGYLASRRACGWNDNETEV